MWLLRMGLVLVRTLTHERSVCSSETMWPMAIAGTGRQSRGGRTGWRLANVINENENGRVLF